MKTKNPIVKYSYILFLFCFLPLTLLLFFMSYFYSANMKSLEDKYIIVQNDSLIVNFIVLLASIVLFYLVYHFLKKKRSANIYKWVTGLSILWALGFSFMWLFINRPDLSDDNAVIYFTSAAFAQNDFSSFQGGKTYLGFYPFQVGILFFYEMIMRLANLLKLSVLSYRIVQLINIPFVFLILYSLNKLTQFLFHNKKITLFVQLLMNLCFPLYIYVGFVYGEIPATALIFFAVYLYLKNISMDKSSPNYKKGKHLIRYLLSFLSFGLGMSIRNSNYVFLIAFTLIICLFILSKKKYRLFLSLFVVLFVSLFSDNAIMKYYEHKSGNQLGEGVAITSLIAMGMQESTFSYGWWNGYHTKLYLALNFDHDLASQQSLEDIQASIQYFISHPDYALEFYTGKFQSQFIDGSINALYSTNMARPELSFFDSIYYGSAYQPFLDFCHGLQMVIYFGTLVSVFFFLYEYVKKKKIYLFQILFLLTVLGGVLFQMIWEANSRYFFTYYLMLFPYAGFGYYKIVLLIDHVRYRKARR